MTKKHFDALAAALKQSAPDGFEPRLAFQSDTASAQWLTDVARISNVCARFTPNFDRARFLAACGVEG